MDYQAFLEQLPSLYTQWGQETVTPKEETFQAILNTLLGETSCNILQLLNRAVGCLESTEIYCEVGPVQGITLVGALLNHRHSIAWTIGDFGTTNDPEGAFEALVNQLAQFGLADQVLLHNQTIASFFYELRSFEVTEKNWCLLLSRRDRLSISASRTYFGQRVPGRSSSNYCR